MPYSGARHVDRRVPEILVEARPGAEGCRLQLGGPARSRRRADRGRAHGARHRARLRAGQADAARAARLARGEGRQGAAARDGRARPARPDHPGGIRRRGAGLRRLRPDRARDRARRFRLPLDAVGAVLAGDASDLLLRHRGAAEEVSAQARQGRARRLLRPDRAGLRLRSGLDGDARREGAERLQAQRRQDVDLQLADRRPRRGLGEARRQDPRLHRRARHQGLLDAEDRGQAVAAHLGHRRDRAGGRRRAGGESAAERVGPRRPVRLPQHGALRHRLGRDGRRGILLAPRAAIRARPQAVQPAARRQPARPEEARRHADRDRARPARRAGARPHAGGRARPRRRRSR